MKRAFVTLLVAALLGALSPGLSALALPLKLPHENPASARETRIEYDLLVTFSDVIDLAARSQYGTARDRLQEMRQAAVPADITYLIDRYGGLYQRLFTELDGLESQLDEISSLLARNRTGEARERLKATETEITEAAALVKETEAATARLDEKLGALSGLLPDDPLARAYDGLQQNVGRLGDIVENLDALKQALSGRYAELAELAPVALSLEVDPAAAFLGDNVTASGWLGSGGRPLSGRTVAIVTGNTTLAKATTVPDGSYEVTVTLPYKYSNSISLTADYEPSGDDAVTYLGAESRPVAIATSYYPSRLTFSVPETVYPGTAFTLTGEVASADGPAGREIVVTLDREVLFDATVTGRFSLEITPPRGTPAGRQQLTVAVLPQGRTAGASETRWVNVALMNRQVRAETPPIVLLSRSIRVRGAVHDGPEPAGGVPVDLSLDGCQTAVLTAPDGTFQADVPLYPVPPAAPLAGNPFYVGAGSGTVPFNLSPIGWQDLEVTVGGPESPSGTFYLKKRVVSVNPLTAGLLAAVFAAAWALAYRRQRQAGTVPAGAPEPEEEAVPPPATPPPAPVPGVTGIRGRVLEAYRSGLAVVEKISGLVMAPGTTLREFLNTASLPSPAARDSFTELTGIAESSLYSPVEPRPATAARAGDLAHIIKEDLDRGAA